jgi:hypothetical protein
MMDAVFVLITGSLWLVLVLMVWGLAKLENSQGERP